MAVIGSARTNVDRTEQTVFSIPTDESIGGILFDLSGFDSPFDGFPMIGDNFANRQVKLINNMYEAEYLGIFDNGFMNGVAYYHLSSFYAYVGGEAPLFIAFVDCTDNWEFVETMQRTCNGKMFQLGIWTAQQVWKRDQFGDISVNGIVSDIESAVEELTGKVGQQSTSPIPMNVVLSPNTYRIAEGTTPLKDIPNAVPCNAPKVSVVICQNNTNEVLRIQAANPHEAPVGCIGIVMAMLNIAGAEESICAVNRFNINKNDDFQFPELPIGGTHIALENVPYASLNQLASHGYIVPVTFEAKEGEYFFSSDSTLSDGDYGNIANNRVIHKCRRCVFTALLTHINGNGLYDSANNGLSNMAIQYIEESIGAGLSGKMVNKEGKYQINGYNIAVIDSENILDTDAVSITYTVGPVNFNGTLTDSVSSK